MSIAGVRITNFGHIMNYKAYNLKISSELVFKGVKESSEEEKADLIIKKGEHFLVTEDSIYLFWDHIGRFKLTKDKVKVDPHLKWMNTC